MLHLSWYEGLRQTRYVTLWLHLPHYFDFSVVWKTGLGWTCCFRLQKLAEINLTNRRCFMSIWGILFYLLPRMAGRLCLDLKIHEVILLWIKAWVNPQISHNTCTSWEFFLFCVFSSVFSDWLLKSLNSVKNCCGPLTRKALGIIFFQTFTHRRPQD